jgi:DNA-binding GntR family transcriptional regulator
VDVEPRRGVVVREMSMRDAEETYELKGVLEALAARLAVEHCTSDLVRRLEEINDILYRDVEEQTLSAKEILDANNEFHLAITDACNNKKLVQQITALRRQTLRYNYVFLSTVTRLHQSADEHQAIITALAHRNADEVERLLRSHNDAALASLRAIMVKKNSI